MIDDLWSRMAEFVTGPRRGPEWRYRFRAFGPIPFALDDPNFIGQIVERGVLPFRERYQERY